MQYGLWRHIILYGTSWKLSRFLASLWNRPSVSFTSRPPTKPIIIIIIIIGTYLYIHGRYTLTANLQVFSHIFSQKAVSFYPCIPNFWHTLFILTYIISISWIGDFFVGKYGSEVIVYWHIITILSYLLLKFPVLFNTIQNWQQYCKCCVKCSNDKLTSFTILI